MRGCLTYKRTGWYNALDSAEDLKTHYELRHPQESINCKERIQPDVAALLKYDRGVPSDV